MCDPCALFRLVGVDPARCCHCLQPECQRLLPCVRGFRSSGAAISDGEGGLVEPRQEELMHLKGIQSPTHKADQICRPFQQEIDEDTAVLFDAAELLGKTRVSATLTRRLLKAQADAPTEDCGDTGSCRRTRSLSPGKATCAISQSTSTLTYGRKLLGPNQCPDEPVAVGPFVQPDACARLHVSSPQSASGRAPSHPRQQRRLSVCRRPPVRWSAPAVSSKCPKRATSRRRSGGRVTESLPDGGVASSKEVDAVRAEELPEAVQEEDCEQEPAEVHILPPPSSDSWDWPLSRAERKARVQMLDWNLLLLDREELAQQVAHLRRSSQGGKSVTAVVA